MAGRPPPAVKIHTLPLPSREGIMPQHPGASTVKEERGKVKGAFLYNPASETLFSGCDCALVRYF